MKKALLLLLVAVACSQAKAQHLFQFKPTDSLKNNLLENYFNVKPGNLQQLFQLQGNPIQTLAFFATSVKVNNYDHMPIAFLPGDSKMPVVKLDGNDKMPVLKMGTPYVQELEKITP